LYFTNEDVGGINFTVMADPRELNLPFWIRNAGHINGSYMEAYQVVYMDDGAEVVFLSSKDRSARFISAKVSDIAIDNPLTYTEILSRGGWVFTIDSMRDTEEFQVPEDICASVKSSYEELGITLPLEMGFESFAQASAAGNVAWADVRPVEDALWTSIDTGVAIKESDPLYSVIGRVLAHKNKDKSSVISIQDKDVILRSYFTGQFKKNTTEIETRENSDFDYGFLDNGASFDEAFYGRDDVVAYFNDKAKENLVQVVELGDKENLALIGNKAKSFQVFKKLGLSFPEGVVIPMPLVENMLLEGNGSLSEKIIQELQQRFQGYSLSVRSSPLHSMPGMLETLTNVNPENLKEDLEHVANSWNSSKAKGFRAANNIPDKSGLAIIIQKMVYGDKSDNSCSGVAFSRNPDTGYRKDLEVSSGTFKINAQGKDIVSGLSAGNLIYELKDKFPQAYKDLINALDKLEETLDYPQEVEFTIEDGVLYFLQTRNILFTPQGELSYLQDTVQNGIITTLKVLPKLESLQKRLATRKVFKIKEGVDIRSKLICKGLTSIPGAMAGMLAFDIITARRFFEQNEGVILVSTLETRSEILENISSFNKVGLITTYGNASSHEAVLTRLAGIPALINIQDVRVDLSNRLLAYKDGVVREGDVLVIDGNDRIFIPEENDVLVEDGRFLDATHGFDIAKFREEFKNPYLKILQTFNKPLNPQEKTKSEQVYRSLLEANIGAWRRFKIAAERTDNRATFVANMEKHFLHELLFETVELFGMNKEQAVRDWAEAIRLEMTKNTGATSATQRIEINPSPASSSSEFNSQGPDSLSRYTGRYAETQEPDLRYRDINTAGSLAMFGFGNIGFDHKKGVITLPYWIQSGPYAHRDWATYTGSRSEDQPYAPLSSHGIKRVLVAEKIKREVKDVRIEYLEGGYRGHCDNWEDLNCYCFIYFPMSELSNVLRILKEEKALVEQMQLAQATDLSRFETGEEQAKVALLKFEYNNKELFAFVKEKELFAIEPLTKGRFRFTFDPHGIVSRAYKDDFLGEIRVSGEDDKVGVVMLKNNFPGIEVIEESLPDGTPYDHTGGYMYNDRLGLTCDKEELELLFFKVISLFPAYYLTMLERKLTTLIKSKNRFYFSFRYLYSAFRIEIDIFYPDKACLTEIVEEYERYINSFLFNGDKPGVSETIKSEYECFCNGKKGCFHRYAVYLDPVSAGAFCLLLQDYLEKAKIENGERVQVKQDGGKKKAVVILAVGLGVFAFFFLSGWYASALEVNSLLTKILSTAAAYCIGDLIAQSFSSGNEKALNKKRLTAQAIWGGATGVILSWLYAWLNFTFTGNFGFIFMVLVDQFVYTAFFVHPVNFLVRAIEEGKIRELPAIIKAQYKTAVITNWVFWIPVLLVNYSLVPLDFRVFYANIFLILWTPILSMLGHGEWSKTVGNFRLHGNDAEQKKEINKLVDLEYPAQLEVNSKNIDDKDGGAVISPAAAEGILRIEQAELKDFLCKMNNNLALIADNLHVGRLSIELPMFISYAALSNKRTIIDPQKNELIFDLGRITSKEDLRAAFWEVCGESYFRQLKDWHDRLSVLGQGQLCMPDFYTDFLRRNLIDRNNLEGVIVDAGTGSGAVAIGLKKAGAKNVIGIDISSYVLSCAKVTMLEEAVDVELVKGDALRLPLRDNSVDAFYFANVLKYLPSSLRKEMLTEVRRALKNSGRLYVYGSQETVMENTDFGVKEVITTEWTRKECEQFLAEAGFALIDIYDCDWGEEV
jgi:hypothetical protein